MTDKTVSVPQLQDEPRCSYERRNGKVCPLTAGFYIGGGQYICYLHILLIPGAMQAVQGQEMVALKGDKP